MRGSSCTTVVISGLPRPRLGPGREPRALVQGPQRSVGTERAFLSEVCSRSAGFHAHSPARLTATTERAGWAVSSPFYTGLDQGFPTCALLASEAGGLLVVGAVLCTVGCSAAPWLLTTKCQQHPPPSSCGNQSPQTPPGVPWEEAPACLRSPDSQGLRQGRSGSARTLDLLTPHPHSSLMPVILHLRSLQTHPHPSLPRSVAWSRASREHHWLHGPLAPSGWASGRHRWGGGKGGVFSPPSLPPSLHTGSEGDSASQALAAPMPPSPQ